ncbi:proQ/FINO family protein [Salmonella enterica]|nr:proQ/FINO family protein [Salmonella enterica]EAY5245258.1 proQ/FINO family protein [Salmonella enterica]
MASKKQQQTQQTRQGAPESDKTTSAHKVKPDSGKTPQKPTSQAGQDSRSSNKSQSGSAGVHQKHKAPHKALQCVSGGDAKKPVQERVRPEGMTRRQWKNIKKMRRLLAFWPELFDMDNPKPLKTGVLDDLMQDISARNLTIGTGVLKATLASYTRRIRYQKALAAGGARYDLNGQPCGEVTAEQQQTQQEAADALKKARDKQEGESAKG